MPQRMRTAPRRLCFAFDLQPPLRGLVSRPAERVMLAGVGIVGTGPVEFLRVGDGGIKAAAKIMNFTQAASEQRIMKNLLKHDKVLMTSIQENMFVFENLIAVDDKNLGILMRNIEPEDLAIALKGADERLRDKIMGCMSVRAAAAILDEMEAKGPMRVTEVQEAQKRIIAIARKLSDAGTMVLAGRGDDYV